MGAHAASYAKQAGEHLLRTEAHALEVQKKYQAHSALCQGSDLPDLSLRDPMAAAHPLNPISNRP